MANTKRAERTMDDSVQVKKSNASSGNKKKTDKKRRAHTISSGIPTARALIKHCCRRCEDKGFVNLHDYTAFMALTKVSQNTINKTIKDSKKFTAKLIYDLIQANGLLKVQYKQIPQAKQVQMPVTA